MPERTASDPVQKRCMEENESREQRYKLMVFDSDYIFQQMPTIFARLNQRNKCETQFDTTDYEEEMRDSFKVEDLHKNVVETLRTKGKFLLNTTTVKANLEGHLFNVIWVLEGHRDDYSIHVSEHKQKHYQKLRSVETREVGKVA